jgi:hypothetical protein
VRQITPDCGHYRSRLRTWSRPSAGRRDISTHYRNSCARCRRLPPAGHVTATWSTRHAGLIPATSRDLELLEHAARGRGLSVASLTATIVHLVVAERLVDAVLDDDRSTAS